MHSYSCLSCGQKSYCPGHEGHIPLVKPCFIPNMLGKHTIKLVFAHQKLLDHIIKCLRCVCPVCSRLLIPAEDIKEHTLDWIADAVTSHATYSLENELLANGLKANRFLQVSFLWSTETRRQDWLWGASG